MRRRRELPDAKIVPFPDNYRGDDSPAAHNATWGPDHDVQPMRAGEVVLFDRPGGLIATFTLHVILKRELGFYLYGCKLVHWGPGQRVFWPERLTTVKMVTAPDDDGTRTLIGPPRHYPATLLRVDSNRGTKAWEEAALRAARYAVDRHRSEQRERSGNSGANANEPPF